MASKVNVKFVIILAAGLLLLAGGAGLLYTLSLKSSADLTKLADQFASQGDWEKATLSMSKAVNKDPNNPALIKKWLEMMTKTQPNTQQKYKEQVDAWYLAIRKLALVDKENLASQMLYLDQRYNDGRRYGNDGAGWSATAQDAESVMNKYADNHPIRAKLRRYVGLARLAMIERGFDMSETERLKVREELDTALASDPSDDQVAAAIGSWLQLMAQEAIRKADKPRAQDMYNEAKNLLRKQVAEHAPAPASQLTMLYVEQAEASRLKTMTNVDGQKLLVAQQPDVARLMDTLEQMDPAKIDEAVAKGAARLAIATGLENGYERAQGVYERMLTARPGHPWLLADRSELALLANKPEENIERLQALINLPDRPLSPEGLALYSLRDMAAVGQVNTQLIKWQRANPEQKKIELDKTIEMRSKLASRAIPDKKLGFIDGALAYAKGDLIEARKKLDQYNRDSERSDVRGLMLLADVLIRQDSLGAAVKELERVLEINSGNLAAIVSLADLHMRMNNYRDAAKLFEAALRLDPENESIKKNLDLARELTSGAKATNPIIRAVTQAQNLTEQALPDMPAALKILRDAEASIADVRDARVLVSSLARLGERDSALAMLERCMARYPDDPNLKVLKEQLSNRDQLGVAIEQIDAQTGASEIDRALMKYLAYRQFGRNDRANEMLEVLSKLDPEHPVVIGSKFDRAIATRNTVEARKLLESARRVNADKLNGLIFETQLLATEGKIDEAIVTASKAIESDKLNAGAYRVLAQMQMAKGQLGPAIDTLQRALQIKPNDTQAITFYLRALQEAGQPADALKYAQEKSTLARGDAGFENLWLQLEYDFGDKPKALDRRRRIFEANPSNLENAIQLAKIHVTERRFDEGQAVLARLLEIDPKLSDLLPIAALQTAVAGGRGDNDGAITSLNKMIDKLPDTNSKLSGYISISRLVGEMGNNELAEVILNKCISLEAPETMLVSRELGDLYFRTGQYDRAAATYGNVRTKSGDPDNRLSLRLVETLIRANDWTRAEKLLGEMMPPGGKPDPLVLLLAGESAARQGNASKTEEYLRQAVRAATGTPMEAQAQLRWAQHLSNFSDRLDEAVTALELALKADPKMSRARIPLAFGYLRQNKPERAVATLRDGLQLLPQDVELRVNLVQILVTNGRADEALDELEQAKKGAEKLSWWFTKGQIYLQQNKPALAADEFAYVWAREKNPTHARTYIEALLTKPSPDTETARAVLAEPKIETDKNPELLLTRAKLSRIERRQSEMQQAIASAIALMDPKAYNPIAGLFVQLQSFMPGREILGIMDNIQPREGFNDTIKLQLATLKLRESDQLNAGLNEMRKLGDSPDKVIAATALRLCGNGLYATKRYEDAAQTYESALLVEQNNPEVLNNLSYVYLRHLGKPKEALELARKADALTPENTSIIDTMGTALMELSQMDDAEREFNRALKLATDAKDKAAPTIHLIELKMKKNDRSSADALYRELQKLIERDPAVRERYKDDIDRIVRQIEGRS